MIKQFLTALLVLTYSYCSSQEIQATTKDGKIVILKEDGTWKYLQQHEPKTQITSTKIPKSATKTLNLPGNKVIIYYDPSLWQQKQSEEPGRYSLLHTDGDVSALIIYERIELNIKDVRTNAVSGISNNFKDYEILQEEERTVNGIKVLCLKIEASTENYKLMYLNYYYTGKAGTVQFMTFTYKHLFKEYETSFNDLLSGLVLKEW